MNVQSRSGLTIEKNYEPKIRNASLTNYTNNKSLTLITLV